MKNKGFTLVEMLGVMTLLTIIFAFVYPNVMEMLEKSKKQDYAEYERTLQLAAEAYINAKKTIPLEGSEVHITFAELMRNEYLSTNVVNPKTKKTTISMPDAVVIVKNESGHLSYTLSIDE